MSKRSYLKTVDAKRFSISIAIEGDDLMVYRTNRYGAHVNRTSVIFEADYSPATWRQAQGTANRAMKG